MNMGNFLLKIQSYKWRRHSTEAKWDLSVHGNTNKCCTVFAAGRQAKHDATVSLAATWTTQYLPPRLL